MKKIIFSIVVIAFIMASCDQKSNHRSNHINDDNMMINDDSTLLNNHSHNMNDGKMMMNNDSTMMYNHSHSVKNGHMMMHNPSTIVNKE